MWLEGLEPDLWIGGPKKLESSAFNKVAREDCISALRSCLIAVMMDDLVRKDRSEATDDELDWFPICTV